MAMKILSSECANCGLCAELCPVKAIEPPDGSATYFIRTDRCTECVGHYAWPRCAAVCPLSCVRKDLLHPEQGYALVAKWRMLAGSESFEMADPRGLEPVFETGEAGA